jgi:hypothetical protein
VDLNGDGNNDILSGSYSRTEEQPMAGLFQVLWGNPDGTFKKAAVLKGTDDKPLIIPSKSEEDIVQSICTRPTAVDWDSDGNLDLVVGNMTGAFHVFKGEGGGKFNPTCQAIKVGDAPLRLPGKHAAHADPFFVDWDKDGDLDLLSGASSGGVVWAENTAGPKKPIVLKAFTTLIEVLPESLGECRPEAVNAPNGSTRVWAADVNGDGKLDVLVGDSTNLISPAKDLSEAEFKSRYADWKESMAGLQKQTEGVEDQKKLEPIYDRMSKLYSERKEFMIEDRTGFVWVYLQK